ncbi:MULTISPECIES: hypothetical protein [Mesorhizobium]|uniref:hypothetical protein n=1 Tax=Mesorhizobium TaxID=68287 RepID=UPI0010A96010|nr:MULTISPECIES: hypothetical protein [Mesorhizobium]
MRTALDASKVQDAFPLYMRYELEVPVNQTGFIVGVRKDYPARLREMISAAIVTYHLQNSSIDYVRRTYLKGLSYEEDAGGQFRIDRQCKQSFLKMVAASGAFLKEYPSLAARDPTIGEWIGDLTLVRVEYSFERAFAEADKGALYECVAISRMILEQLCWVYCVRLLDDVDAVASKNATKCVGEAGRVFPIIGRLYGWLSDHAHWAYSAHLKVITQKEDQSAAMLASSQFKAIAYAMLLVLAEVYLRVIDSIARSNRKRALTATRKNWLEAASQFKPQPLLTQIVRLSDKSADVVSLRKILKDQPRHG